MTGCCGRTCPTSLDVIAKSSRPSLRLDGHPIPKTLHLPNLALSLLAPLWSLRRPSYGGNLGPITPMVPLATQSMLVRRLSDASRAALGMVPSGFAPTVERSSPPRHSLWRNAPLELDEPRAAEPQPRSLHQGERICPPWRGHHSVARGPATREEIIQK
jgi:hypothetical protein